MGKRLTITEFIDKAVKVHGDKYSYEYSVYNGSHSNLEIYCKIHKKTFWMWPSNHLFGQNCPICARINADLKQTKTTEQFITEAISIHGTKYNYSKSIYTLDRNKITIWCNRCSIYFEQCASDHLQGKGCKFCATKDKKVCQPKLLETFIMEANSVHNFKYNYSESEYINANTKTKILCSIHGPFNQAPSLHLRGAGCPRCIPRISKPEIEWLNSLNIENLIRNETIHINKKRISPDGFDLSTNTIYEFYGSYYHGDPTKYAADEYNQTCKTTFGELYQKTMDREKLIKSAGYNLITIWESEWNKLKKS